MEFILSIEPHFCEAGLGREARRARARKRLNERRRIVGKIIRVAVESVRAAHVTGEIVFDPVVVDVGTQLECVAAHEAREVVRELLTLDIGKTRRYGTRSKGKRGNAALTQNRFRTGRI